jgi:hypothetical protein
VNLKRGLALFNFRRPCDALETALRRSMDGTKDKEGLTLFRERA